METWTIKTKAGDDIYKNITDINEWLKNHSEVFVIVQLQAIKVLIIAE